MTCKQFRKLLKLNPLSCTRAERDAMRKHKDCAPCMKMLAKLAPSTSVFAPAAQVIGAAINLSDLMANDPEAR